MDFVKKEWQFRDIISENELNRMEDGIEEGITKAEQAQDDLAAHTAATTGVHGATSAATPNTLVQRDPDGRFKAAAPSAADDVARKDTVDNAIAALRGAAPGTLDTLAKLAQAINNDPNFAATISAALAGKVDKTGGIVTGDLALYRDANGDLARFRVRNAFQYVDIGAYWEEGVTQFAQIQSADVVAENPQALRLNPHGGLVTINDYIAWHHGNNPANLATSGYQKLANGLILQWGVVLDVPNNTPINVVFPITFPNICFTAVATLDSTSDAVAPFVMNSVSPSGFIVTHTASLNRIIRWIAIGR
jgi:hypothetical protein